MKFDKLYNSYLTEALKYKAKIQDVGMDKKGYQKGLQWLRVQEYEGYKTWETDAHAITNKIISLIAAANQKDADEFVKGISGGKKIKLHPVSSLTFMDAPSYT